MGGDGTGEAGAGNGRTGVWLQLNVHNAGLHDVRGDILSSALEIGMSTLL